MTTATIDVELKDGEPWQFWLYVLVDNKSLGIRIEDYEFKMLKEMGVEMES